MQKNIEYQIMAHENGWAVVVCDVIGALTPADTLLLRPQSSWRAR